MAHDAGQDRARAEAAARGVAAARDAYERSAAAVEFTLNALTASTSRTAADLRAVAAASARNRAGLRDLAMRGLAAADTNIRAAFDCLETMARAASAQDAVAAQAAFVREQTRRSLDQAVDLQRAAGDLLHAALPGLHSARKT